MSPARARAPARPLAAGCPRSPPRCRPGRRSSRRQRLRRTRRARRPGRSRLLPRRARRLRLPLPPAAPRRHARSRARRRTRLRACRRNERPRAQPTCACPSRSGRVFGVNRLRRELGGLETWALSIGVLAPALALSIASVEPAKLLGRAAPLAFMIASVWVGVVCYGFVRLSSRFSHAGSVYAFNGRTLGPRAGFVTGWALLGTYIVFPPVSIAGIAVFGQAFFDSAGISDDVPWLPIALVAWALVWLLASGRVKRTLRVLLGLEALSVLLILVLVGIVFVKLLSGDTPRGQELSFDWLSVPDGVA